jgi:hypothetical protein
VSGSDHCDPCGFNTAPILVGALVGAVGAMTIDAIAMGYEPEEAAAGTSARWLPVVRVAERDSRGHAVTTLGLAVSF